MRPFARSSISSVRAAIEDLSQQGAFLVTAYEEKPFSVLVEVLGAALEVFVDAGGNGGYGESGDRDDRDECNEPDVADFGHLDAGDQLHERSRAETAARINRLAVRHPLVSS